VNDEPRLPIGAQAALDSILDISPIVKATVEPADEAPVLDLRDLDVSDLDATSAPQAVDPYYDLGAIAENAPLTDHLFTTAPD
jgi:hypothetical protein